MEIALNKGEIICIDGDARQLEIVCCSGVIWVTQAGDAGDYILHAARRFRVASKGRIAINACVDARLEVVSPATLKNRDIPVRMEMLPA